MNDDNDKQQFVKGLYSDMENQLNDVYEQKKESRNELLKVIGEILLTYTILNNVISLSKSEYNKEYVLLSKLIKKHTEDDIGQINSIVYNITKKTIDKTFNFYSYNHNFKDVEKIVNENFRGKHFSERVWDNEKEVAKKLNKQCQDFLKGKINVNQIKKTIEKTYNTSAYNAKRLVETEVARCHSAAFDRFGQEVGVKKVRYNSILDRKTCDDCSQYDEKIYNFDKKPELPRHPMCRCYYDIVDDDYIEITSKMSADASDIGMPKEGTLISNEDFKNFESSIDKLGMRIEGFENYKGDVQILNELVEDLIIIKDTQPSIADMKNGLLIKYEDLGNINDFAVSHKKSISFNSKVYNDSFYLKQSYEQSEKCGFFVKGTDYRSVIYHESGHILCSRNLKLQNELEKYIIDKAEASNLSVNDYIVKNISGYAIEKDYKTEKYKELLPEIMSMCYNNGNNKEIGNMILKELKLR